MTKSNEKSPGRKHKMETQASKKEIETRRLLEKRLEPDEVLLAYTRGKHDQIYHIGLTGERLLLLPAAGGRLLSIQRHYINILKWTFLTGVVTVKLRQDDLVFRCGRSWRTRGKHLVEVSEQTTAPAETDDSTRSTAQRLQQVQDFQELGLLNLAQAELARAARLDPALDSNPLAAPLRQTVADQSLALRVGGGFFLVSLVILVGLAVAGIVQLNLVGIFICIFAGVNLWNRRPQWRTAGVILALLNTLIFGLSFLESAGVLGLSVWIAFTAAVIIVLTGESTRERIWLAVSIYAIGHLGGLGLLTGVALL